MGGPDFNLVVKAKFYRFGRIVTLIQGHQQGRQNFFPQTYANHNKSEKDNVNDFSR